MINDTTKEYIENLRNLNENREFSSFRKECEENNIPIITKDVEDLLKIMIKSCNVHSILEIGTAVGYSSIVFASQVAGKGNIVSIERDENRANSAIENIKKYNLENSIKVIKDDAREFIARDNGKYDLIFLDGNKGHYIHMLDDCLRLLNAGGLLICDNVLFRGMIDNSREVIRRKITIVKRLRKFLHQISIDDRLSTTILPIGDGLSISIKK